jgi:hypothetical protein
MASPELDERVREMVRWHFDPATGSRYWVGKARALGFDPVREVRGAGDLLRFPAVADEWRSVDAADLIPRGCGGPFAVWETGGTTGAPRRIVDAAERRHGIERVSALLDEHGFPRAPGAALAAGGPPAWLHLGPTGPHLVGTNVGRLARMRGALCHTIDMDPRWVKRLNREGRSAEVARYIAHLTDQALDVLRTQPVQVVAATPALLQALCDRPECQALLLKGVRGVIWFGTSMSEESLRFFAEELLPGVRLVGWYGNTLMGIACQRPRQPGDPFRCIFTPPGSAWVRVVDPNQPHREMACGEAGQVCISVVNRELFLPWHLERDWAVSVAAARPAFSDDLARVEPLGGGGLQTEGVY